jgi:hypothetical protein
MRIKLASFLTNVDICKIWDYADLGFETNAATRRRATIPAAPQAAMFTVGFCGNLIEMPMNAQISTSA